ncbi:Hypothetical protein SMAX5B_004592 [Scophthalmus maximus]|uniref:Uncharacterized protein n=1 Tax=Scophthalmus maximus TaxID=52904 RepID=A0A2U9BHS5_SCOMX|nr:Hypothetical protein SMAX5B_004592 [Scophthalmus maximus]
MNYKNLSGSVSMFQCFTTIESFTPIMASHVKYRCRNELWVVYISFLSQRKLHGFETSRGFLCSPRFCLAASTQHPCEA